MPPNQTSNELRLGILGRTQRDSKVELSHFVDMNNHSHTLAVSNHCEKLSKFYMELQKKTTDAVKALLGLKSLSNLLGGWRSLESSILIRLRGSVKR